MSSNIIGPLPKKSEVPSERVKNPSWYLGNIKDTVGNNIYTVDKEDESRKMCLRKPTHILYQQKRRFTKLTKHINHKYPNKIVNTSTKNKTDTLNSMDKSSSIAITNLFNKSTIIENPSKIYIQRNHLGVFFLAWTRRQFSKCNNI